MEAYAAEVGLSAALAQQLRLRAELEAKANRLVPLLSVPVSVRSGERLEKQSVEVFEGEDIAAEVAAFAQRHGLAEEDHRVVREVVLREARVAGVMPLLTITVNFTTSPGLSGPLPVFYGDTVESAAARFEERLGLPDGLPADVHAELRQVVSREGVKQRVFPLYKALHSVGGKDVAVELYQGDDVAAVVRRLAAAAGLGAQDSAALVGAVKAAASKAKALPALTVPIKVSHCCSALPRPTGGGQRPQPAPEKQSNEVCH